MDRLRELLAGMRARDVAFMSGYALYLVFGYMSFESPTVLTSLGEAGSFVQSLFLMAVISARLLVYAVMITVARRTASHVSSLLAVVVCGGAAATGFVVTRMAFQFAGFVPLADLVPWLVFGGLFFGAGDALINLLWARFCGTFDLRRVYLFVLVSNVVSLAVYFSVTLLPPDIMLPVGAVLFFASVLFCKRSLDARMSLAEEYSAPVFKGALSALWRPMLGTAILSFMSGLMLQVTARQDIPLATFQQTSLVTQAVVVGALLLPALFVKSRPSLGSVYKVALPLSAAGFLLLPLIWSGVGGLANACAQLGTLVAGIILWCMLASAVHDTKLPAVLLFSCSLVCTNAAQLAGTIVGFLNADTVGQGDLELTAVALVAVYLVAMVSMFLFKDKHLQGMDAGGDAVAMPAAERLDDALEARCDAVAQAHGFTPREAEILVHLGQGRTARA
ncbi:LuxR family transcriptional regulator, partial [Gordonibacter sp.]|uniref:LuxR family transcriptional regulator n=1 Tax=Gordonibacter sp. TaxID=1968902 RepID=UPI002FC873DB